MGRLYPYSKLVLTQALFHSIKHLKMRGMSDHPVSLMPRMMAFGDDYDGDMPPTFDPIKKQKKKLYTRSENMKLVDKLSMVEFALSYKTLFIRFLLNSLDNIPMISDDYVHVSLDTESYSFLYKEMCNRNRIIKANDNGYFDINYRNINKVDPNFNISNLSKSETAFTSDSSPIRFLDLGKGTLAFMTSISNRHLFIIGKNSRKKFNKIFKSLILSKTNLPIKADTPLIYTNNRFNSSGMMIGKKYSEVISKEKDMIINTIDTWRAKKEIYEKYNIVHKIGIILHGKPGTGKTSLIKLIISQYNANYIKLSNYDLDGDLGYKLSASLSKTNLNVVVFEDVDCLLYENNQQIMYNRNSNDGDDESDDIGNGINAIMANTVSEKFRSLLNVLDGMDSKSNIIFIATTNHFEKLDEAFVRDGRFDLKVEMKYFDREEAESMCGMFNVDPALILDPEMTTICPATLQKDILLKIDENIKNDNLK